jgi:NADPH:quinone reductase-like Zn-dependent oxidoreductase
MTATSIAVASMRVAQIAGTGASFEIVEREIPRPEPGQRRIKVQAGGICHSDVLTKEGHWPGIQYPRIPGHEVVGVINELGLGVSCYTSGQRVLDGTEDTSARALRVVLVTSPGNLVAIQGIGILAISGFNTQISSATRLR